MSTLAFFPWLNVDGPVSLAPFRLVPYERSRKPGGVLQAAVDTVLEPYLDTVKPLRRATLVHLEAKPLLDDLSEAEIAQYFRFRDLITLSGLASREYFGLGMRYYNRDNFILIIQ
ncbi:MAG: hypothetical protein ACYSWU_28530, partial [Planctomycetota bacterium]